MIYETLPSSETVSQGDILDDCRLLRWEHSKAGLPDVVKDIQSRVIVVTQACDAVSPKTTRIEVTAVHNANELVEVGVLKAQTIRDQVRRHQVYGWYFLPTRPGLEESIVNLRELHTIPREILESLLADGKRLCRLVTPYREHMAQHFSTTYSRIGLPAPYGTEQ